MSGQTPTTKTNNNYEHLVALTHKLKEQTAKLPTTSDGKKFDTNTKKNIKDVKQSIEEMQKLLNTLNDSNEFITTNSSKYQEKLKAETALCLAQLARATAKIYASASSNKKENKLPKAIQNAKTIQQKFSTQPGYILTLNDQDNITPPQKTSANDSSHQANTIGQARLMVLETIKQKTNQASQQTSQPTSHLSSQFLQRKKELATAIIFAEQKLSKKINKAENSTYYTEKLNTQLRPTHAPLVEKIKQLKNTLQNPSLPEKQQTEIRKFIGILDGLNDFFALPGNQNIEESEVIRRWLNSPMSNNQNRNHASQFMRAKKVLAAESKSAHYFPSEIAQTIHHILFESNHSNNSAIQKLQKEINRLSQDKSNTHALQKALSLGKLAEKLTPESRPAEILSAIAEWRKSADNNSSQRIIEQPRGSAISNFFSDIRTTSAQTVDSLWIAAANDVRDAMASDEGTAQTLRKITTYIQQHSVNKTSAGVVLTLQNLFEQLLVKIKEKKQNFQTIISDWLDNPSVIDPEKTNRTFMAKKVLTLLGIEKQSVSSESVSSEIVKQLPPTPQKAMDRPTTPSTAIQDAQDKGTEQQVTSTFFQTALPEQTVTGQLTTPNTAIQDAEKETIEVTHRTVTYKTPPRQSASVCEVTDKTPPRQSTSFLNRLLSYFFSASPKTNGITETQSPQALGKKAPTQATLKKSKYAIDLTPDETTAWHSLNRPKQ
jgi:hypothetical protein